MQAVESCSICLEELDGCGEHRALQLECGHIYGRSCIVEWLAMHKKKAHCPRCNAPSGQAHQRRELCAVVDGLQARDGEQEAMLISSIEQHRAERKRSHEEAERLKRERTQLERDGAAVEALLRADALARDGGGDQHGEPSEPSVKSICIDPAPSSLPPPAKEQKCAAAESWEGKRRLAHSLPHQGGRVLDFGRGGGLVVVSHLPQHSERGATPSGGNKGHGLTLLSLRGAPRPRRLDAHAGPVRDIRVSHHDAHAEAGDGTALTLSIGLDGAMALCSLHSLSLLQSFALPSRGFSCSWDERDSHVVYAACDKGSLLVFDIRRAHSPLASLHAPGVGNQPITSIRHMRFPDPPPFLPPTEVGPIEAGQTADGLVLASSSWLGFVSRSWGDKDSTPLRSGMGADAIPDSLVHSPFSLSNENDPTAADERAVWAPLPLAGRQCTGVAVHAHSGAIVASFRRGEFFLIAFTELIKWELSPTTSQLTERGCVHSQLSPLQGERNLSLYTS